MMKPVLAADALVCAPCDVQAIFSDHGSMRLKLIANGANMAPARIVLP